MEKPFTNHPFLGVFLLFQAQGVPSYRSISNISRTWHWWRYCQWRPNLEWENASVGAATRLFAVSGFPRSPVRYSRGLKSEQFSWMWTNRLRKSRHDRVTAGSQQSIKTQGDCLYLKDTKYHYNKHERAHPSHCRLLFCQHCFALQTIILPQWFDLRRSKTEWTKETMKREEVTVCEKEREEDKKRNKQRTQMKTSAENTTERPPEQPPNDPWFMSCQAHWPQHEVRNSLRHRTPSSSQTIK